MSFHISDIFVKDFGAYMESLLRHLSVFFAVHNLPEHLRFLALNISTILAFLCSGV